MAKPKKPQNIYMPIDAFCGRVFGAAEGAERSAWVSRFALSLAGNGNEEFALELLSQARADIEDNRERQARYRAKRKQNPEALVSRPKSLPGTSSGNGEALNDEGATAPAGQSFEARQATPGVRQQGASGKPSTPVPVSAHGDAAEGGLLTPWYGPGTGETFDQETTRADARIREDRDASATVRAQHFDGDAATREGAVDNLTPQGEASESATSPSNLQNRPGKSADASGSPNHGGSERGDGGLPIPADQKGEGGLLTAPSPTPPLGIMKNVRISPEELGRYRAEYGDHTRLIDALSTYIAKSGKRYKSHFAALVSWARRDIERGIDPETGSKADQLSRIRFAARAEGIDAFSGKRIDFATGEVIEPGTESAPEIPYNPLELGEAE